MCKSSWLRDNLSSRLQYRSRVVDLNCLYQRHQVSLFLADNARCERSRRSHRELADGYAAMIWTAKGAVPRSFAG